MNKELEKLYRDIDKAKKRLTGKKVVENFGQDEVRKIKDKYFELTQGATYEAYCNAINSFDEWCGNYTGR